MFFYAQENISRDVVAQCHVEDGPTYQMKLTGEAAVISYSLDSAHVDFGLQVCLASYVFIPQALPTKNKILELEDAKAIKDKFLQTYRVHNKILVQKNQANRAGKDQSKTRSQIPNRSGTKGKQAENMRELEQRV